MKKLMYQTTTALLLASANTRAGTLPTAPKTSTADTDSDTLTYLTGLMKDGFKMLSLGLSVLGFLWLAWNLLADLNAARTGRKEWGEVGMGAGVGAIAFGYVSYLLMKANNIF